MEPNPSKYRLLILLMMVILFLLIPNFTLGVLELVRMAFSLARFAN